MKKDLELSEAIFKIIRGEQINIILENWQISNLSTIKVIDLFYNQGDAIYSFIIDNERKFLRFTNLHREAKKGSGTKSLRELEIILKLVSKKLNKRIQLIFPKFNQEDTALWLERNGYISINDQEDNILFVKEIN